MRSGSGIVSKKRLSYTEGSWIAVPLADQTYALGLIARANGKGGILAYFFGPRLDQLPSVIDPEMHRGDQVVLVARCGDLGLLDSSWKILGRVSDWNREVWAMPTFGRLESSGTRGFRLQISEADLVTIVRMEATSPEEANALPPNYIWGHKAVEKELSRILGC